MINRHAPASILVNDGERGTRHGVIAPESGDEAFHQTSFSGAQISLQREHRSRLDSSGKASPKFLGIGRAIGSERSHEEKVEG